MAIDLTVLEPSIVTELISRIAVPGNTIQRFLGFEPGGRNVQRLTPDGATSYQYDIFDNVRSIAKARAVDAPAASIKKNPVGTNTVNVVRFAEKLPGLSLNLLSQIRQLGKNAGELDTRGMTYLEEQGLYVRQRQVNAREYMAWSMLKGSGSLKIVNDDWIPVASGGEITLDFKIPTGNTLKLNMLGAGDIIGTSWDQAAAPIPGDLDAISSAFQQLHGAPLSWVLTDSTVWNYVLDNTAVKAQAGTSNTAFDVFEMSGEKATDGTLTGLRYGVLKCRPWIKWFITDAGLDLDDGTGTLTFTKYYDGTMASFGVDLAYGYAKLEEASELVKDAPWKEATWRRGVWNWLREWDDPASVELFGLQRLACRLTVPKALAYSTVKY